MACFSPRRNTSRKMARASGPQYSICQHSAMGHIAAPSMYPHSKARLFEQQRCDQAHHRAHDAHDHQRDGVGDELRAVRGAHNTLRVLSPLLWKILHERPGTSGQFFRTAAGFNIAQKQNLFFVRSANRQIVLLPV